jgi:hypothetical protein
LRVLERSRHSGGVGDQTGEPNRACEVATLGTLDSTEETFDLISVFVDFFLLYCTVF